MLTKRDLIRFKKLVIVTLSLAWTGLELYLFILTLYWLNFSLDLMGLIPLWLKFSTGLFYLVIGGALAVGLVRLLRTRDWDFD